MSDAPEEAIPERFENLRQRFTARPLVTEGTGFARSGGLRVGGRIFVIFGEHEITVKLPKARVDDLVAQNVGRLFDPGHGRLMRQWLTVPASHADAWEVLAEEAFAFVGGER
jgi:hypothetical protein